ncbi:MAG TPA: hypothetical protein VLY24_24100 [Bryobacteraceae bacterium]|nr:hypothetical protein [Bryobacteraceae bacterium]
MTIPALLDFRMWVAPEGYPHRVIRWLPDGDTAALLAESPNIVSFVPILAGVLPRPSIFGRAGARSFSPLAEKANRFVGPLPSLESGPVRVFSPLGVPEWFDINPKLLSPGKNFGARKSTTG